MDKPYIKLDLSENDTCDTEEGCTVYVNIVYTHEDGELISELPRMVARSELYY
jgi:hypothetical protein